MILLALADREAEHDRQRDRGLPLRGGGDHRLARRRAPDDVARIGRGEAEA
jgi:hypothetical protein